MSKFKDPYGTERGKIDLSQISHPDLEPSSNIATYLAWKTASANLEREIDLFWRRGLYFWGFIAAVFVARAAETSGALFTKADSFLTISLSALGFVVSYCWILACRGSKYWQKNWEVKVSALEKNITGPLMGTLEQDEWTTEEFDRWETRYSVSKLAVLVAGATTIFWFLILCYDAYELWQKHMGTPPYRESLEPAILFALTIAAITILISQTTKSKD